MNPTVPCLKPLGGCLLGLTVASQSVVAQAAATSVDTRDAIASADWADNVTITID